MVMKSKKCVISFDVTFKPYLMVNIAYDTKIKTFISSFFQSLSNTTPSCKKLKVKT